MCTASDSSFKHVLKHLKQGVLKKPRTYRFILLAGNWKEMSKGIVLWSRPFLHQRVCIRYLSCAKCWIRNTVREGEGSFWPQESYSLNFGILVGMYHESQKQLKTKVSFHRMYVL